MHSTPQLIGLAIYCLTMYIDVATDYKLWLSHIGVKHNRGAWLRMIGISAASILMGWPGVEAAHLWQNILITTGFALFLCAVYWMCFDGFLNNKRHFNWWFTGGGGSGAAKLDLWLKKRTLPQIKMIKIGGMAVTFAILLVTIRQLSIYGLEYIS